MTPQLSSHRTPSFQRARRRQQVVALIWDIDKAIGETERMLSGQLEEAIMQTALEQLPALRAARQELRQTLSQAS